MSPVSHMEEKPNQTKSRKLNWQLVGFYRAESAFPNLQAIKSTGLVDLLTNRMSDIELLARDAVVACSYNLVAIPLATGLLKPSLGMSLTPALAAVFMAGSSTLVILSSLGLKLYTRPGEPTALQMLVSLTVILSYHYR